MTKEYIKIKAAVLDPTGVKVSKNEMYLEKVTNYPARILLTIGGYNWYVTSNGKLIERQ